MLMLPCQKCYMTLQFVTVKCKHKHMAKDSERFIQVLTKLIIIFSEMLLLSIDETHIGKLT